MRGMPAEFDQPVLVGVQVQGECRQPVAQFRQEPLGIGTVLETDDRVVGVAHLERDWASGPQLAAELMVGAGGDPRSTCS